MPNACVQIVDGVWVARGYITKLYPQMYAASKAGGYNTTDFPTARPQFVYNLVHSIFRHVTSVFSHFSPLSTVPITSTAN
jgi:hypothetical protein